MTDSQNEDLLSAARRADQQGGNPLFEINPECLHHPRSWQRGTVVQMAIRFQLEKLRPANGEVLGEAISEAFMQGLQQFIRSQNIQPVEEYSMSFQIHHNAGTHTWTSSPVIPLTEWLQGSERSRAWLDKLTRQLNSSEGLDATGGEFYAELLFFKNRGCGSGYKKLNPGNLSYEQLLKKKKCIVTIQNKDDLCAAWAIISMKALADGDPEYPNLRNGGGQQEFRAHKLHQESGVPEGPCGLQEIKQFQAFLVPRYQIFVFEGQQGLLWFKDRALNGAPKKIVLLKVEQQFQGLRSIPALLNHTYYCHHCEKGYNEETAEKHNCVGQNCMACKRTNQTCLNFATFVTLQVYCKDCNRRFYGQNCYEAQKQSKKNNEGKELRPCVCRRIQKCPECCKEVTLGKKERKHVCYEYYCRNCDAYVLGDHPCYIQPIVEKEKKKKSGLRRTAELEEEEKIKLEVEENEGGEEKKKVEPLVCVIDFKCAKDENLVGWQYIGQDFSYREAGTADEMLRDVMAHTITKEHEERKVYVFAHNMHGFDSSFIFNVLYGLGYKIVKILSMGAKYLSFQCGDMVFRDSLNFFNMLLEKLPATFNLREAHKGFFSI